MIHLSLIKKSIPFIAFCLPFLASSQNQEQPAASPFFNQDTKRKGALFVQWGYNRGEYTDSDIRFKGTDYDFTLSSVHAIDRPETFDWKEYASPVTLSIPQYNFGIGYYLTDHFAISFNVDHMKYVMVQDNTVKINGEISPVASAKYGAVYHNQDIQLSTDFLKFEHTDGLNYLNIEGSYAQEIYSTKKRIFAIEGISGIAVGMMLPKSNVTLLNYGRNDEFHVAGFGVSGHLGINLVFFRRIYFQGNMKGGWIDMPDIVTRGTDVSDRASQNFFFSQENIMLGVNIPLIKHK